MSQMVLPQTPAAGAQPDAGSKKPAGANEKSGDSRFDSVSVAEQKRLDQKQAARRDEAQANEANRQRDRDSARASEKDSQTEAPVRNQKKAASSESEAKETESTTPDQTAGVAQEDTELTEPLPVLTFAELQALIAPGRATTPGSGTLPGMGQQGPAMAGVLGMLSGMTPGVSGKVGEAGSSGVTSGFQFAEALTALASESGRPQDSTSLLASGRVQSLADVSGQQLANATTKLPADATGLRGYATSVDVPVGHAEWGDKLVGKLAWLTANKLSVAEIHLTPPDMGPMEVRVQVQQEHANITVHAANPAVRDQLELHSHRLRDMLGEHGLSLEKFDVADSASQQPDGGDAGGQGEGSSRGSDVELAGVESEELEGVSGALDLTWKGEVDIFA